MNNLLERLHASFFFYILTSITTFVNFGGYLASAILVSVSMIFGGLRLWVVAGWKRGMMVRVIPDDKENEKEPKKEWPTAVPLTVWRRRDRPVIRVLAIMLVTHVIGYAVFLLLTAPFFFRKVSISSAAFVSALLIWFLGKDTRIVRAIHSTCHPSITCSTSFHSETPYSMPTAFVSSKEDCTTSALASHLKGIQSIHLKHSDIHHLGAELQSRSCFSCASRRPARSRWTNLPALTVPVGPDRESDGVTGNCVTGSRRAGDYPRAYENGMGVAGARCLVPPFRLCSIPAPHPSGPARLRNAQRMIVLIRNAKLYSCERNARAN